jgi:glycosyltransferase involved in cell wall biosynthesis
VNDKLVRITTVPVSLQVLLRKQLQFMSGHFEVLAVSSPGRMLEEVCNSEGVRTEPVVMTRAITPWQDIKAVWSLYRLFKRENPAIVHTHTPKAGLLGMMAARMAGVPVRLHTVAGLPLMENRGIKRKILEYAERFTYACATAIYPNSGKLASFLLKNRYCRPQKMKVLGNGSSNGIDTDFFSPHQVPLADAINLRESLQLQPGDFIFVFIGRLVKDKGIEELVEAFIQLAGKYTNVKLLLVGPYEPEFDPLSPEIVTTITTCKDIVRVGFQQDVRPWLLISHVLVFPSYREGFPNVPMQAGCFNVPAIVTDINGCNEIIEHGKNGLIIPVKNVAALREAMEIMMTNKELYLRLKAQARQFIIERYEQQYFWSLLLQEYRDQLKKYRLVP